MLVAQLCLDGLDPEIRVHVHKYNSWLLSSFLFQILPVCLSHSGQNAQIFQKQSPLSGPLEVTLTQRVCVGRNKYLKRT